MLVFLSVVVILTVLYLGICVFYYLIQEKLIFVRFPTKRKYKYKVKLAHEEVFLRSFDQKRLHALYFNAAKPKGLVLYFHGNTGTLKRWAKNARYFIANDYDVLMPDPRGYGKSKGKLSESALFKDADQWYQEALTRTGEDRVIVYGRSLGSALAVRVAAEKQPKCLVLETPFADLYDVAKHYAAFLPYKWLLRYPFSNDLTIRKVTVPVYIFHGKKDLVVPYKSALRLYSCVPVDTYREMITIDKGRHNDLAKFEAYHTKMAEILR